MPFDKWLRNKLDEYQRRELLSELLAILSDEEKAQVVDDLATELNDNGHDWRDASLDQPVESVNMDMLKLNEMFEPTKLGELPILRTDEERDRVVSNRAFADVFDFARGTLMKHHGVCEFEAYDDYMDMGP